MKKGKIGIGSKVKVSLSECKIYSDFHIERSGHVGYVVQKRLDGFDVFFDEEDSSGRNGMFFDLDDLVLMGD